MIAAARERICEGRTQAPKPEPTRRIEEPENVKGIAASAKTGRLFIGTYARLASIRSACGRDRRQALARSMLLRLQFFQRLPRLRRLGIGGQRGEQMALGFLPLAVAHRQNAQVEVRAVVVG